LSSERSVFVTDLNRVRDYQFKVKFDLPGMPELLADESEPLGKNAGPNPSRLLSAAVGDCLSSSLIFCLSKGRIAVNDLKTSVETVIQRNEKGRWRIAALKVKLQPIIREEDVSRSKRCLELFEDFCVVTESVRKGIEVSVDVEMGSSGSDDASAIA
jgi:organic hydroperoxide reductase OsmC/OhrA